MRYLSVLFVVSAACQPPVDPITPDPCDAVLDGICVKNRVAGYTPNYAALSWGISQVATLVDVPNWEGIGVEIWIDATDGLLARTDFHPVDGEYRLIRMSVRPGDDQCHNLTHPVGRELLHLYGWHRLGIRETPAIYPGYSTDEKELSDRSKWCAPEFDGCRVVDWGPAPGTCPD